MGIYDRRITVKRRSQLKPEDCNSIPIFFPISCSKNRPEVCIYMYIHIWHRKVQGRTDILHIYVYMHTSVYSRGLLTHSMVYPDPNKSFREGRRGGFPCWYRYRTPWGGQMAWDRPAACVEDCLEKMWPGAHLHKLGHMCCIFNLH